MRTFLIAMAVAATIVTSGACAAVPEKNQAAENGPQPSTVDTATPPASVPSSDPAPAGLFVEMRAAGHPGFERLVFEFGGDKAPPHRIREVNEVRQDPTDKLLSLQGKRFLVVVFEGGTLDTTRAEPDPAKARRYTGPQRITPDLPLLKEVAVAGDFEAVLSFGVGLSGHATMEVQELTSPARLVIDLRGQ